MKTAIVLFTGVEELDAIAPYEVLSACKNLGYDLSVDLVTHENEGMVQAFHGLRLGEVRSLKETREHDLLIIPGGAWLAGGYTGVRKAVEDKTLPGRIKSLYEQGTILASVCTGAMLLGAAGLLKGRAATTHHSAIESLRDFEADIRTERVVDDGNILSAGGVTSGLDLALWIVERFLGEAAARKTEDYLEYKRRGLVRQRQAPLGTEEAPYDLIAEEWANARCRLMPIEEEYLEKFLRDLPAGASVLDYGCGAGHPIGSHFVAKGYKVTGVDGSRKLLDKARERHPDQEWIESKLESSCLDKRYERIICWDALFHIRREYHEAILRKFYQWLEPGGKVLMSSGGSAQEPFRDTMFEQVFFYDSHPPAEFVALVKEVGFEIEMKDFPDLPSGGRNKGKFAVMARKPVPSHS